MKSLTSGQWNIATFVRHCGKCETTNVPGWNVARRELWELKSDEYKAAHPFVELSWVLPQQAPPTPPAVKKAKALKKAKEDRPKSSLFAFTAFNNSDSLSLIKADAASGAAQRRCQRRLPQARCVHIASLRSAAQRGAYRARRTGTFCGRRPAQCGRGRAVRLAQTELAPETACLAGGSSGQSRRLEKQRRCFCGQIEGSDSESEAKTI